MKKLVTKFAAALSACTVLTCSAAVTVSANTAEPDLNEVAVSETMYTLMESMGFSAAQIAQITSETRVPNEYLAYVNVNRSSQLTGTANVYIKVVTNGCSYNGIANGLQGYATCLYNGSSADLFSAVISSFSTSSLTDYQFPNVMRAKYTGSTGISSSDVTFYSSSDAAAYSGDLSLGAVEAGNVTKYVTGSTDTSSLISYADASRIQTHYANMLAHLTDSDWTDETSVAADVNFDNQVDMLDAQKILVYLSDSTVTFF